MECDLRTHGKITGTWGYYLTISATARMANITGHNDDAARYSNLAVVIREAFNAAFFNDAAGHYTNAGNNSTANATQATQALALDAGLVPEEYREQVLNALVNLTYSYPSSDSQGPHLSGGTIGLGPIVRALSAGGRDDILWGALQQKDRPSYGYFIESTQANPNGFNTIGEEWDRSVSKNHMILAQIEEWFHATVVGIRPGALTTISTSWGSGLVFQPTPIGDLTWASGSYRMPEGEARSEWELSDGVFPLSVPSGGTWWLVEVGDFKRVASYGNPFQVPGRLAERNKKLTEMLASRFVVQVIVWSGSKPEQTSGQVVVAPSVICERSLVRVADML